MATKTYSYMGLQVTVPDWATYIAMDRNFFVYAFRNTPAFDTNADEWTFPASASDYQFIGTLHQISGAPTSILQLVLSL